MSFEQYEYTCKVCDCTFEAASPEWFEDKGLTPPERCPDCRSSGRRVEYEYVCGICGKDFTAAPPEWFEKKGLSEPTRCEDCRNAKPESHTYICKICGGNFEAAPPKWFREKDLTPPKRCEKCKSSGKRVEYKYICRVCENTFTAAPPEWFKEKGLNQPARCVECKKKAKNEGWVTGHEHKTKGDDEYKKKLGPSHTDTYHVNEAGERDRPHSEDLKVSGSKHKSSITDIRFPKK